MAENINLLFRRGSVANIDSADMIPGSISFTTDEPGIYLDLSATEAGSDTPQRVRVGDFIPVQNIEVLKGQLTAGKKFSTQALYYSIDENMLMRYNGEKFVLINDYSALATKVTALQDKDAEHDSALAANAKAITDEVSARESAISGLQEQINSMTGSSDGVSLASLKAALDAEIEARVENDDEHTEKLNDHDAELLTQSQAINNLTVLVGSLPEGVSGTIVSYLSGLIAEEQSRAEAAEQANASAISEANGKISSNTTKITEEVARAQGAEQALSQRITTAQETADNTATAVNTEKSRAEDAENALSDRIDGLSSTVSDLDTALDQEVADRQSAVAEVKSTADGAASKAAANESAIAAETTRATNKEVELAQTISAGDNALGLRIDEAEDSIADNNAAIQAADKKIDDESDRATTEEARLAGLIDKNASDITSEAQTRASEITRVEGLISTANEGTAQLSSRIGAVEKDMTQAKADITANSSLITTLTDNLNKEIARAKAAEQANEAAITAETNRAKQAEGDLDAKIIKEAGDRETAIEEAKTDLTEQFQAADAELLQTINDNIAAANAMTFKGEVAAFADLPTTNIGGGDTYVVTTAFNEDVYQIGDLLIASSDFTGTHTAGSQDQIDFWIHVETGYSTWQDAKLAVIDGKIELQSHLGETLGIIDIGPAADNKNITTTVTGSGINCAVSIGFVWDTF